MCECWLGHVVSFESRRANQSHVQIAFAIVVCFPHLNTWHLWALTAVLAGLFAATWFEGWRDLMIDLLDPLFVVRSDTDKALPGKQRETLRRCSWVCCIVCGAVAMWDIMLHPVQEGLFELPGDMLHGLDDGQWKPGEGRDETALLWAAAESLGTEALSLKKQALFEEHRLLLFKYEAQKDSQRPTTPIHTKWKTSSNSPQGDLAKIIDTSFPAVLNVTLCLHVHAHTELAKVGQNEEKEQAGETTTPPSHPLPEEFSEIVGSSADAREAYFAGCKWWTDTLDSFYGHPENLTDLDEEHHSSADSVDLPTADADVEGSDLA
eukprot:symbB.v1.2.035175.t1/scaffold4679.1/size42772/3